MQSDRLSKIQDERSYLDEERVRTPHLFPENTWIDDNIFLEKLGIYIPDKDFLPAGYLKFAPSDFIVEEITASGKQTTIDHELDKTKDSPGETVYATLVKCGLSTIEAVDELAKIINIPKERIQYAGIKDKEAITSQEISIRGIQKDILSNISSQQFFLKDIRIGKGVVEKGGLKGNRFSILIRTDNLDRDSSNAAVKAIERVKNGGFYNFFYLQRFGLPRLNNYKWGISVLKGEYNKAVLGLIGDPGLREIPYFINIRKEAVSLAPDWSAVLNKLEKLPIIFGNEIKAIKHLKKNPTDFLGALKQIEDQVTLWISAVSSILFNRILSAYVLAGVQPPKTLPLFISKDRNDWLPYTEDLESLGILPPDFRNLMPFNSILIKHREIKTKDHADVEKVEILPAGILVRFTLGKGEYATTFLSHFINLVNGKPSENISKEIVDIKKIFDLTEDNKTLNYFKEANSLKLK